MESVCLLLSPVRLFETPWLLCPWKSPGKNIEVGCHSLLQGLLLTQGTMEKEAEITDVTSHPAAVSLSCFLT